MTHDWRKCVSCCGTGSVVDHGSREERPCSLCRKDEYAAWIRERQPATRRIAKLNDRGQCCGRKPLVYKRPAHHLYCTRCSAELDPITGVQQANWAWVPDGDAFVATSPTADYASPAKSTSLQETGE